MPPDALALIRRATAEARAAAAAPAAPPPALEVRSRQTLPLARPLPAFPPRAAYFPDFVSATDESTLLQHIMGAPAGRWTRGRGRRTQNWGGRPSAATVAEALPAWLCVMVDALVASGAWPADEPPPNHVIINEYEPGAGLTPHTDGPLYLARVATLSLMSDVVMELHEPVDEAVACEEGTRLGRLLLRQRSLNVLSDEAYRCFHGIRWAGSDVVDEGVANFRAADATDGEEVRRARRVSIVFVSKLATL